MNDAQPAMRQDVIRQWARERNLAIGSRGRLPQSVFEAFQRENAASAANDGHPQDGAQPADSEFGPLEPLARYLEPQFGNIYDWDSTVVPYISDDFFQPWTDEVRQAVRNYLLYEAPEHLLDRTFPERKETRSEEWVDEVLQGYQPWKVALRFHEAAVALLPTLDALIGNLQAWPYEDDREDAIYWLEGHTTDSQLRWLATVSEQADLVQRPYYANRAFDIVQRLEPPALLKAWHEVVRPAASDLTDAEWQLLEPLLPKHRNASPPPVQRQAINGMLFQHAYRGYHRSLPRCYGERAVVESRKIYYKRTGKLADMLKSLEDKPEAARIVAWLGSELAR